MENDLLVCKLWAFVFILLKFSNQATLPRVFWNILYYA